MWSILVDFFTMMIDAGIVTIALPRMQKDLHAGLTLLAWGAIAGPVTVSALIVTGVVLLPLFIVWQARMGNDALVPLRLLGDRSFSAAVVGTAAMVLGLGWRALAMLPHAPIVSILAAMTVIGLGNAGIWSPASPSPRPPGPRTGGGAERVGPECRVSAPGPRRHGVEQRGPLRGVVHRDDQ